MGLGAGIFLIAIGAILTWAVKNPSDGSVDVHVVGVVLMVAGLAGIFLSLLFRESWAGAGWVRRRGYPVTAAVPDGQARSTWSRYGPPVHWSWSRYGPRRTYVEEEEAAPPPDAPPPW